MSYTKGKVTPGCLLAERVTQVTRFSMPPKARLWRHATELRTLSVAYPLCGSALTNTKDNPSEKWPLKLTDFCLLLYHQLYSILQWLLIPPMAFTSCQDRGSNRLPPDGRASTLTTQPLRLAKLLASWLSITNLSSKLNSVQEMSGCTLGSLKR